MITQARFDTILRAGNDHVEQAGVKGMRWGVRKAVSRVADAATDVITVAEAARNPVSAAAAAGVVANRGQQAAKAVSKATAANLIEVGRGSAVAVLSVAAGLATVGLLNDSGTSPEGQLGGGIAGGVAVRTALTVGTSRTPGKVAGRIGKKTVLNLAKLGTITAAGHAAHKAMEGRYLETTVALIEKT